MGVFGWGNTGAGWVCISASTCRITGREKGQISYKAVAKAGDSGYEVGLPGWPTPL